MKELHMEDTANKDRYKGNDGKGDMKKQDSLGAAELPDPGTQPQG
jgi:hypothetical protein